MANAITAHTIENGARKLILQFNAVADGSGELTDYTLIDLNDYVGDGAQAYGNFKVPTDFAVMKVSGNASLAVSFKLFFGAQAGTNRLFFENPLTTDVAAPFENDWSDIGGLATGQPNTDLTVRITTSGFGSNNDMFFLVVWIKKKYKVSSS